jgi:4-diphosphocytidyl-2-C-methyl-D-erythritol kinase
MRLLATACAKVNLVLRVGPRRDDGYHDLASLVVPLDLSDLVEVRVGGRTVRCEVPGWPQLSGPQNLAARAAVLFSRRFGTPPGCAIRIEKRIPVTAGLGGGSSDAAAVLRALSFAHGVRDRRALCEVGLSIGSDVPFFLGGGAAWMSGRGEALHPARVPPLHLVLVYPRDPVLAIRAADAYRFLDQDRPRARAPAPGRWPLPLRNDLETPCFRRHPTLVGLRDHLAGAGARGAIMSGSGPTVFGLFGSRSAARVAAAGLRRTLGGDVEVILARSRQRHPGVTTWRSPRSASSR